MHILLHNFQMVVSDSPFLELNKQSLRQLCDRILGHNIETSPRSGTFQDYTCGATRDIIPFVRSVPASVL